MGKKLGIEKYCESVQALNQYFNDNNKENGPYTAKVRVYNKINGRLTLNVQPSIVTVVDNISTRISIMWEDDGSELEGFRELGLDGYYDCAWVPMRYENGVLEIDSPDSDKIVKVYL